MSSILQHRRGTTAQHSTFTGAVGEFTYDTDKKTIVAHDGVTAGGSPLAKESTISFPGSSMGLVGASDATTPTTKFNLSADSVTTRDTTGRPKTYFSLASKTVDISVASALGGRDQAAAFSANAEPNLFFVPDGSGSLGLVASLNGPNTGPTGYSEWAIAANLKLNGGAQIIQGSIAGAEFQLAAPAALVTGGTGLFPSSLSHSSVVPAAALRLTVNGLAFVTTTGSRGNLTASLGTSAGVSMASVVIYAPASETSTSWLAATLHQTIARALNYGASAATGGATSYGQSVQVVSYTMRNGAR